MSSDYYEEEDSSGYPWTEDELLITFMEAECGITSFTDNTDNLDITCTLLTNANNDNKVSGVAGDWIPKVHFEGIGFALTTSLSATTLELEVNIESEIVGSKNGGTIIPIPGSYFGFSLDNAYDTSVTIGGSDCEIISLTNTEITCITPVDNDSNTNYKTLVVSVNSETV